MDNPASSGLWLLEQARPDMRDYAVVVNATAFLADLDSRMYDALPRRMRELLDIDLDGYPLAAATSATVYYSDDVLYSYPEGDEIVDVKSPVVEVEFMFSFDGGYELTVSALTIRGDERLAFDGGWSLRGPYPSRGNTGGPQKLTDTR